MMLVTLMKWLRKLQGVLGMRDKNLCRWYDHTSAMKRAYDQGYLDEKWVREYCWNGGKNCVRKKRFEGQGYVSPSYVLPDGSEDEELKKLVKEGKL